MRELTNLFIQFPGDFFFYITVVLALCAALAVATVQGVPKRHASRRRYVVGLMAALLGWVLLLAGALYAVFVQTDPRLILPPLERAVTAAFVMLITWAIANTESPQWQRTTTAMLFIGLMSVTLGYLATGVMWSRLTGVDFNLSQLAILWTFVQALVALIGLMSVLVGIRYIFDAPLKMVFFALLLFGFGGTLWQMANGLLIGDYSGLARLSVFMAVPILPYVVFRAVVRDYNQALNVPTSASPPTESAALGSTPAAPVSAAPLSQVVARPQSSPVERESVQLLRTLGLILEESEPSEIPMRIVRASVEVLKADVGALLSVKNPNYADILIAYDHAMQRPIPAMFSLNLQQQITLWNAIDRKQQRPLFVDRNLEELEDLYSRLDVPQMGPAYFQPLMRDDELIAILVIGLPYTKRELRDAERELLKGIGIISGSLLALSYAADEATVRAEERAIHAVLSGVPLDEVNDEDVLVAHREMQGALEAQRIQNEALQKQIAQLKIQLDDERTRLTHLMGDTEQGLSITQRIVALNDDHERLRNERDQLAQRLLQAETALAASAVPDDAALFNTQIEQLHREKHTLTLELEALRGQLTEIQELATVSPQEAEQVLNKMDAERSRLQDDRNRLGERLQEIESQLHTLGIEGGLAGLAQVVQKLSEERSRLQVRMDALQTERDALLNERKRFEQRMRKEEEREAQIETMEAEIRHLATDREAISRQRDRLRSERDQLAQKVDTIKEQRARLLADLSVYQEELQETQIQLARFQNQMMMLSAERDQQRAELTSLTHEREQLLARIDGDRGRLQQLSNNAQDELRTMIEQITAQRNQLERELQQARAALTNTRVQRPAWVTDAAVASNGVNPQVLMNMVDGLRTPMTGIVSYIDLLVTDSAGILSDQQRKIIQRVSANVTRLQTMLNDLSLITALDTAAYKLKLKTVNIVELIEDTLTNATYQFREKGLTVHLDLDDTLPEVNLDERALEQVMGQLITNACVVSAAEGEVSLSVSRSQFEGLGSDDAPFLVISITDSGGGIAEDDLPEVFARRYRTEHQLINGLGDTGVGLSIAKALVEAHGGVMWVESQARVGTTFYAALPMNLSLETA